MIAHEDDRNYYSYDIHHTERHCIRCTRSETRSAQGAEIVHRVYVKHRYRHLRVCTRSHSTIYAFTAPFMSDETIRGANRPNDRQLWAYVRQRWTCAITSQ